VLHLIFILYLLALCFSCLILDSLILTCPFYFQTIQFDQTTVWTLYNHLQSERFYALLRQTFCLVSSSTLVTEIILVQQRDHLLFQTILGFFSFISLVLMLKNHSLTLVHSDLFFFTQSPAPSTFTLVIICCCF
jgi:hypothetical protein